MTIQSHRGKWLVTVHRASALPGFQRIRRYRDTREEAESLEREIEAAIETYGKWPVDAGDRPFRVPAVAHRHTATVRKPYKPTGTLREAMDLTLQNHWHGKRYEESVRYTANIAVSFFETIHCPDIDDITSADIDELIKHLREKEYAPGTINKTMSALRVINKLALLRIPPLATITLPLPHLKGRRIEKWWMRPEDHQKATAALRDPQCGRLVTDPMFADLIDLICYQGLRVEEALRLEPRMVVGLETPEPWLQTPGTKTADAQNSIPIYPEAVPPLRSAIGRAERQRWARLFPYKPRQTQDRWNDVRDFLGVRHIPTATMKSLRRTFAWYANSKGMPTSTLQKVLRHKGIGTTAGYLDLVGDQSLNDSRKYFAPDDSATLQGVGAQRKALGGNVVEIIKAYAQTPGVTPEDVARFAKELMV